MTMVHVGANAEIHRCAPTHTNMIHILVSAFASLTHVQHINTSTRIPVVVAVVRNQPAPAINTSMIHPANAIAVMLLDAAQENTMTMTHVIASVKIHQLAMLHTTMIQTHASVSANLMAAILASTLTTTSVAVSVQSTRPAQIINTSTAQLANVSAVTLKNVKMDNTMITTHVNVSVEIHQLASILTITTQTLVNVIADPMTAILLSISITKAVAANAQSTRPAQTINISMVQLVSVSAVT